MKENLTELVCIFEKETKEIIRNYIFLNDDENRM